MIRCPKCDALISKPEDKTIRTVWCESCGRPVFLKIEPEEKKSE